MTLIAIQLVRPAAMGAVRINRATTLQIRPPAAPPVFAARFLAPVVGAGRRNAALVQQSRIPRAGSAPNAPGLTAPLQLVLPGGVPVYVVKQGTTWPPLTVLLRDANGPVPLNQATGLEIRLRPQGGAATTVRGTGTGDAGGNFRYTWGASDLQTVGTAQMEIKVSWGNFVARFPDANFAQVQIVPNLD